MLAPGAAKQLWCTSLLFLPQDDVDRLQPGGDVSFGDLWGVGFEHVRLCGLHVGHRRGQALPQAQQVVNTVGSKLPVLAAAKRERGEGKQ